ncbi:MAG: shikimate dehydrogenase [Acidobacteria bacterium]|nr:MAG: shikimate dehydrogenase [Acidobacteriota bacterium]
MGLFGTGVRRICAVVAASTAAEMSKMVRSALRQTRTVELRLDWLSSDAERARFLDWLGKGQPRNATFLAACRRREGGGKFAGAVDRELYWLIQAREAGCQWCDLEVETLRKLPGQSVRKYPVPPRVLLSVHDFERTPDLPRSMNPPANGGVDAVKIAAEARSIHDSLRLLRVARSSKGFVAVPMGEAGLPARILALREGSELAYAPVAEATASGQVSLDEMKHLYRAHALTRRTRVYGVIGDPIGHSLSPLLHNRGFAARSIDAVCLPFLVHQLGDFLAAVPEFGVRGFSVTLPHKQTILKHLRECEPLAAEIGAVNTVVVRRDGSFHGRNTDYVGVLRALEKKLQIKGSRALIFGAGGSARAAAFALSRAGAIVGICARREKAAKELARAVGGEVVPRRALRTEFFDAILNATPVGMHPHDGISPLAPGELHCRIVMDLIYRPQKTHLLELAAQKGIAAVSGVEMFLAQGIAQWEIWTEKRAPEAAMRRAVLGALRAEESYHQAKPRRRP